MTSELATAYVRGLQGNHSKYVKVGLSIFQCALLMYWVFIGDACEYPEVVDQPQVKRHLRSRIVDYDVFPAGQCHLQALCSLLPRSGR